MHCINNAHAGCTSPCNEASSLAEDRLLYDDWTLSAQIQFGPLHACIYVPWLLLDHCNRVAIGICRQAYWSENRKVENWFWGETVMWGIISGRELRQGLWLAGRDEHTGCAS